ncbi:MAG: hypothetical protein FWD53_02090 [Phycisphaerales bacterium]|nr:hypothetical protein [Phycisphaerales bacterium]
MPNSPTFNDAAAELEQYLRTESLTRPITLTRAPGRLDVIGGIADYTGSLVCTATLDRATAVALAPRNDRTLQITNLRPCDPQDSTTFTISLDELATASLPTLRTRFKKNNAWAAYIAGCLYILHEKNLINLHPPTVHGADLWILGHVPPGGGVSSSAALEVASMLNLANHYRAPHGNAVVDPRSRKSTLENTCGVANLAQFIDPLQLCVLCQEVENRIVGAPCGIMDQISSHLGNTNQLLQLLCQPHTIRDPLTLPTGTRVIGINTKVKHAITGPRYALTRCAAFMGHRIILNMMPPPAPSTDPMNGYLANLPTIEYNQLYRPHLPTEMDGKTFLTTFGPTIDTATQINPTTTYHIRAATDHHVYSAQWSTRFAEALTNNQLHDAGQQMYAAHHSYTHNAKLGAPECDLLVTLTQQHAHSGLHGARITGGGSGGTVAILCDKSPLADAAIQKILQTYTHHTGHDAELFDGSSPGAWEWGIRLIKQSELQS